jgi:hypothetical protein
VHVPASWAEVLFAFFVWALLTSSFVVILSQIIVSAPSEWLLALLVALLVLLANFVIVPVLVGPAGSPEHWKAGFVMIAGLVFLLLFMVGLPRLVFGSLGVGYIFCESGTVLVNRAAADKIWRVLPDAIDREEPMPVLIQKYDVVIVSKIGKEALLKFSLGPNEGWSEKVFVPTESIVDYRQVPQ